MNVKILITLVLMFLSLSVAWSAGFDCDKAKSDVENIICANHELSDRDLDLSEIYHAVLLMADDKSKIRQEQKDWLINKRNICKGKDCLIGAYDARLEKIIRDLTSMAARAQGKENKIFPSGIYIMKGVNQSLIINDSGQFSISGGDDYARTCTLGGAIGGVVGVGYVEKITDDSWKDIAAHRGCLLFLDGDANSFELNGINGSSNVCNEECGMNMNFSGKYYKLPEQCKNLSIEQVAKHAWAGEKKMAERSVPEALMEALNQCKEFMMPIDVNDLANAIADSYYKKGDFGKCMNALRFSYAFNDWNDRKITRKKQPSESQSGAEELTGIPEMDAQRAYAASSYRTSELKRKCSKK